MDYTRLDDQTLIHLIANVQADALSELYDRYGRLVYSLALNSLGERSLAEEVTQDVFLRVWEKAGTYRPEQAKVSTWLTSITRNRSIDLLRKQRSQRNSRDAFWEEMTSDAIQATDGASAEEQVEHRLKKQRVRRALARLPEDQQRTLAMAYFYGLSHSKIANETGTPIGTVKTRIRLGMQKLRQYLKE